MGTAAFAVPPLQKLFEDGYPISAVVTQPDKPAGRGQAMQFSPVKKAAHDLQLHIHQPKTLRDDQARMLFEALAPALIVVVAYGKILPPWLIQLPQYGVINLHGSLLPKYRGAAPIQWAVANGETETGVCAMQIDEGLDTGPVYLCESTPIDPDESVGELAGRLSTIGSQLISRVIPGIFSGTLKPTPQDHTRASHAPILRRQDGYIDWTMSAHTIHDRVRAFNPWPGTVTQFRGAVCKILKSKVGQAAPEGALPGTIVATKRSVSVVCGDAVLLELLEVQLPNRKPLSGSDFLNGMRVLPSEKFERVSDN